MAVIPSASASTVTWTADNPSQGSTWTNDSITEVFDVLGDIDGNLIVDTAGNYINMGGGMVPDIASVSTTLIPDVSGSAVTWTAEG